MLYDCIVAGGGPAGSICSLILQKQGINCLLLEKRTYIDEKICGGFIPDRCRKQFLACGIDLEGMLTCGNRIDGYFETRNGKIKTFSYKKNQFGIGVCRKNLDSFLLHQTSLAGTKVVCGERVSEYVKIDEGYAVNGYRGRYLVWATGAKPPLQINAFDTNAVRERICNQSIGVSEIIQSDVCSLNNHAVYFWYAGDSNDYFWAIPVKENTWNIGYWSQQDRKNLKTKFIEGRKKWIESNCREIQVIQSPRGALLGNVDFSECLTEKEMFCCGDLAGTNNILTGEGISQAVQSARKTAATIIQLNEKGVF